MSEEQKPVELPQDETQPLESSAIAEKLSRLDSVESQPESALPLYEDISVALDGALHRSDERPSP